MGKDIGFHIVSRKLAWCMELMTEGLRGLRHLPAPLSKTEIYNDYCIQREVGDAWLKLFY